MQNQEAPSTRAGQDKRERVGLAVFGPDAGTVVATIAAAEAAGVRQIWMTQGTPMADTMTIFAAAAVQTKTVRMGTAIVPTYPRHPLAMAQQALTLCDLMPQRFLLGIGPSHRPVIEGVYGIPMINPLEHLREYVTILRAGLWEGNIDHHGRFFNVRSSFPRPPRTPILISALGEGAFHLAGEISDGALSWVCTVPYLVEKALPALRVGADKANRPAPPLIAHVPVAVNEDRSAVLAAARRQLGRYGRMPFYAHMFAEAGFPVASDGSMPDALLDNLVVSGDEAAITSHINALLEQGLDELLLMPIGVVDADGEQKRLAKLIGQL